MIPTRCVWGSVRHVGGPPAKAATAARFQFQATQLTVKQLLRFKWVDTVAINGCSTSGPSGSVRALCLGRLRDVAGDTIQLVDSQDAQLVDCSLESAVQATGSLERKVGGGDAGGYEIRLQRLQVLNAANGTPAQLQGNKALGAFPPEYRCLQLRLRENQQLLRSRYEVALQIRSVLDGAHFTEVETPLLFKPTPEGAREFLVPTRQRSRFFALTQSPQQYKQLLMASGVHRYFQFARCFRDEDLRRDRQPEFTQVDLEMAFATGSDVMRTVEDVVVPVWSAHAVQGPLLTLAEGPTLVEARGLLKRLSYRHVMTKYGIDKPDLRAPAFQITSLEDNHVRATENERFPVFEVLVVRGGSAPSGEWWTKLVHPDLYNSRTPLAVPIDTDEARDHWFERFSPMASFEDTSLINEQLNLQRGDVVFGSTREPDHMLFENPTPLGRLRQLILATPWGQSNLFETQADVGAWVVDFPLFSPVETTTTTGTKRKYPNYEADKYISTHHPFTMVQLDTYQNLETSPLECLGQHYDLVINGVELGGGSTRIHDTALQDYIFKNVLDIHNSHELFGHLLDALAMGAPPHAGFAIGFDRMCAMLLGRDSIRDVLPFPKSVNGSDLVVKSPAVVPESVLKSYHIQYLKE
ncbi:aspartate--tRNA ligase MSD1 KNAG_0A01720 [Huiozyma naganishii CBS 8797]|uniref:Aminoacyl-transfer RNA synthetases class-II family profile domain-containing protein n=1 Tax=Huiozyma naganishii (strain ATCC MYA-139 / BCRC 22969 / CBS 8797 / KCTC 17520 / NBRC 10181 / NCYC 3082 / Yp74L-3) TaxID=1071383 RepID=J7S387_HUIN7|nr:hypothetical protein KNAG_0A01720 [Kazachstania naganishii CBS 8797]CCK67861.1 hypothetical protein KNAG_0A01720 [Kazachstania naganishii CBS 8797]